MNIKCPNKASGRHRWKAVSGKPHDHRECSQCNASARIDHMGRTVFVALVQVARATVTIRRSA